MIPFAPPGFTGPTSRSSLTALQASMRAFFTLIGQPAPIYLGLKNRDLWDTSRVVIIDGEFSGSNTPTIRSAGRFDAPWQKQSINPRELVAWYRPVTLSIRAVDPTNPDSEAAQIVATELLIEQTIQALWNAMAVDDQGNNIPLGQANVEFGESKAFWIDPGTATQQTWGKEFLIQFLYKCVFFDTALKVVVPTFDLQKGPMLTSPVSGVNAACKSAAPAAGTAVITGLGMCTPVLVGRHLVLSGAATPANNGSFRIAALGIPSSTTVVIANPAAVAPDANNGSIVWSVSP